MLPVSAGGELQTRTTRRTRRVYLGTVTALNSSAPILDATGLRAIVESDCAKQKMLGNSFEKRIDGFAAAGLPSTAEAKFLLKHRFPATSRRTRLSRRIRRR